MTQPDPTVGELSEREVLARILARLAPSDAIVGPGDDAAVLDLAGPIVATVDTLVHGPDFRLAWSNGFDLGWKAAAVNLADVAAMGARPTSLLVALAMPESTPASFVERLADGLSAACAALAPGCRVEGGDLTVSDTLTIAVTALGALDGRPPVTRVGARPGEVVALSGDAGTAAAGLRILFERFVDASGAPIPVEEGSLTEDELRAIAAQLRPEPPVADGIAAAATATAMLDVSDGLLLDAGRLAAASGVVVSLDSTTLGNDPATALGGGEDHALLATFPVDAALPGGFRPIGVVVAGDPGVWVDGREAPRDTGWDPYRDWDSGRG